MSLPTIAGVNTAISSIFAALAAKPQAMNARRAVSDFTSIYAFIERLYTPLVDVPITDSADADIAELLSPSGSVGAAAGGRQVRAGDVFQVGGAGDTTDNALTAAKGSVPSAGDLFAASAVNAVVYVGNTSTPLDFSGKYVSDFVAS